MTLSRRAFLLGAPAAVLGACAKAGGGRAAAPTPPSSATTAPAPSTTTRPGGRSAFVRRGPAAHPTVALTFHGSGDVALLDELLAVAAAHRAKLTIFAVGQWLDANPPVARRILAGGHELANHTYTHPALGRVSAEEARLEASRCRDALVAHAGTPGRWFRPSGVEVPGDTILGAAAAAGYPTVVGYDVDPHDYQDPGAAQVRSRVSTGLAPGAIVSLHTGHRGTVDALGGILDDAAAKGLRAVTVSELLGP
ncbi:MAG TPA: polysaccharide deacetylase family protein [Acidimicrobiales bacterium]|nr:polysaccharide deacetylase family protein [Acidimicrobiales bacterium]